MELFSDDNRESIPEIPDNVKLEDVVGEGKKYKTNEDAAKALLHKDLHISRLEAENATFRGELKVRTTLEEFLDKMKTSSAEPNNRETPPNEQPEKSTVTQEQLEALIKAKLVEHETTSKADANIRSLQEVLKEAWGANWQNELSTRTAKLGVGKAFVTDLAAQQPMAVLKLLDVEQKTQELPTLQSRTTSIPNSQSGSKTNSYYRKMMREKPKEYWRAETQLEMFNQAKTLGDAFYA